IESEDSGEKGSLRGIPAGLRDAELCLEISGIAGVDGFAVAIDATADGLFPLDGAWWSRVFRSRAGISGGVFRAAAEPGADCFDCQRAAGYGALVGESSVPGGNCDGVTAIAQ